MAHMDHAFSISNEDIMKEASYVVQNWPPVKEIALLVIFVVLGIIIGSFMAVNRAGNDEAQGISLSILGDIFFLPGFSFANIPIVAV